MDETQEEPLTNFAKINAIKLKAVAACKEKYSKSLENGGEVNIPFKPVSDVIDAYFDSFKGKRGAGKPYNSAVDKVYAKVMSGSFHLLSEKFGHEIEKIAIEAILPIANQNCDESPVNFQAMVSTDDHGSKGGRRIIRSTKPFS